VEIRTCDVRHSTTEWEVSDENATEYVVTESVIIFYFWLK